ncbi:MAG: putative transposase [Candidatus Azotimanducaceae bacterium]|jgi:putative transposase
MRFLSRLTVNNIFSGALWKIVTDKLRRYGVAHRELMPATIHSTELSHQPTRVRERGMRRSDVSGFKSAKQAQRFLNIHAAVYNFFNVARHLVAAETYRYFRLRSFASWKNAAMV